MDSFAARLRASRKALGLSQEEVAKRVGIKQGSYSELERGKSKTSRHLIQLAQVLNVDPHWLATGVEVPEVDTQIVDALKGADLEIKAIVLQILRRCR